MFTGLRCRGLRFRVYDVGLRGLGLKVYDDVGFRDLGAYGLGSRLWVSSYLMAEEKWHMS